MAETYSSVSKRTSMNSWDSEELVATVKASGRKKLVICALWTEACLLFPTLCAIEDGFEIYFVTDASGGTSLEAHEAAIRRMEQAGAHPLTTVAPTKESNDRMVGNGRDGSTVITPDAVAVWDA